MKVGARYYDPQVGAFTTRDTYLEQKPYLYCEHDPVNALDPSGHSPWNDWWTGLGTGLGGLGGGGIGHWIGKIIGGAWAGGAEGTVFEPGYGTVIGVIIGGALGGVGGGLITDELPELKRIIKERAHENHKEIEELSKHGMGPY